MNVDFYSLARAIQDRFVGSTMSGFPPAPLASARGGTSTKTLWLGVSGACFFALMVVARIGYGSLDSALSLHSALALPLYGGLVFGLVFGILQAYARVVRERGLPYAPGVYLFPACLIDARTEAFQIHGTDGLVSAQAASPNAVKVTFAGGASFTLPVPAGHAPEAVAAEVLAAKARAAEARLSEDPKELVAVDPLHNPRFSSPVGPRDPYAMSLPPYKRLGWVVALVIAVFVGPMTWGIRNHASDSTMFAHASQTNDTTSFRAYLARGRRFKDNVAGVLLPRAELRDAEKQGTVDALLAYKAAHPDSRIEGEVALAIRSAMLTELDKAKAKGDLGSLEAFAKRYPEHGVGPELGAATHAVYTRELEAYRKRSPLADKAAAAFVERLFAKVEKLGPKIEIRFRKKKSESLGRADTDVGKSASFMGEVSYPTKYFDEKRAPRREELAGKALAGRLDAGLSPELVDVVLGAAVPDDVLPDAKVPTLFVVYTPEWSGHAFPTTRPRGIFVGIAFNFEVSFVLPGDPRPFKWKLEVKKMPPLPLLKEVGDWPAPGTAEEKLYDAMATEAFEQMTAKLLLQFFRDK